MIYGTMVTFDLDLVIVQRVIIKKKLSVRCMKYGVYTFALSPGNLFMSYITGSEHLCLW